MKLRFAFLLGLLIGLCQLSAAAQSEDFFPLEAVKPGLQGIGKTVFAGTQVDTFAVEILGVLENVQGPRRSLILARLSGSGLDELGVFQGMSGSPVYIEDKLVGAIAYAFSFATIPVAGITPIQDMVTVFREKVPTSFRLDERLSPARLYEPLSLAQSAHLLNIARFPVTAQFEQYGQLRPIATPLNIAGFDARTISEFAPHLKRLGLSPVLGTASARLNDIPDFPLEAGSTVSVQLIRGDMDVSASGTVTHISGDKVYAFGHPFMGMGFTDMPLNKAAVLTVIPNWMAGQKMSATGPFFGSIRQDRSTGIMGLKGVQPKLIPVSLKLRTSRKEEHQFQYELVTDNFLTPFLLAFSVHNSILSSERSIGSQTLQVKCRISIQGQPEVRFENSVSDLASSPTLAALTASSPVNFLLNSGFEDLVMERIDLEISSVEVTREAVLEKVWQDKIEVRAGEEVGITVFLRQPNGVILSEKYPIQIPRDVQSGLLKIEVGDGISLTRSDADLEDTEFVPQNLGQLVKAINNLKKNDRLYIRLFREQDGAVVAGEGLPNLPPSMLAVYSSQKTSGDARPINRVVIREHELPPTESVLSGRKVITVQVKG